MSRRDQPLSPASLEIDHGAVVKSVSDRLRQILSTDLHRRGFVVALSGGIDSSVSAALCVDAVGKSRVYGLLLPEQDSAEVSTSRGHMLAEHLGIEFEEFSIASTLHEIGCYAQRDAAIREVFPSYEEGWPNKIIIGGGLEGRINHFSLVVQTPDKALHEERLPLRAYLKIVAATNFKQRIRKTVEYFHADRLNYAVVGTPNRLEYDQGFFVKNGDGSADVKPIAHLYKSQVYSLARYLALPDEICSAVPTTDTYSLEQGQDEFYFALPYDQMDLALFALNNGYGADELAGTLGIESSDAVLVYKDIERKRVTTRYLHASGLLVEPVPEIGGYLGS